jgi:hypothetical protein
MRIGLMVVSVSVSWAATRSPAKEPPRSNRGP